MAIDVGELRARLTADTSQLNKRLKGSTKSVGAFKKAAVAAGVAVAAAFAFKKAISFVLDLAKAAGIQEKAMVDLTAALTRAGVDGAAAAADDFAEFAAQLQKTTIFGDEATIQAASIAASFGITGEQLKRTSALAGDLSTVLGTDLKAAMILLGKAAKGEVGSLSRYGIIIDKNLAPGEKFEAVLEAVNKQFGGAAAAQADTYLGRVTSLGNAWGDLKETIGSRTRNVIVDITVALQAAIIAWDKFIGAVAATTTVVTPFDETIKLARRDLADVEAGIRRTQSRLDQAQNSWLGSAAAVARHQEELVKLGAEQGFVAEALGQNIAAQKRWTESQNAAKKAATEVTNALKLQTEAMAARSEALVRATALANLEAEARKANEEAAAEFDAAKAKREKDASDLLKERIAAGISEQERAIEKAKQVGDTLVAAFDAGATGAENWANVTKAAAGVALDAIRDAVIKAIAAHAAEGAAAAAKSVAGIPVVGPALAVGAATLIFGLIRGFLGKFHEGGELTQANLTRLPGMAPTEGVFIGEVGETVVPADGQPMQPGIVNNFITQTIGFPSRAQERRYLHTTLVPALAGVEG